MTTDIVSELALLEARYDYLTQTMRMLKLTMNEYWWTARAAPVEADGKFFENAHRELLRQLKRATKEREAVLAAIRSMNSKEDA